jgi:hypothetical protein
LTKDVLMDTVPAFLANYSADGFDLALLVASMFCAGVLGVFAVGHLVAAVTQCGRRARLARALRGWIAIAQ